MTYNPLNGIRVAPVRDLMAKGFEGNQINDVMYELTANREDERLILESASFEEIDETYNQGDIVVGMVFEAITVRSYAQTESKMKALAKSLSRSFSKDIQPIKDEAGTYQVTVGKPKKAGGLFASVTAQIPFTDGQVLSIVFHSPEGDKLKVGAGDEIIAYRFLLNKRDITHVVSPEKGKDVTLEELSKRVTKIVEKNSEKFQAKQVQIKEQKTELIAVEADLEKATVALDDEIQSLAVKKDEFGAIDGKIEKSRSLVEKLEGEAAAKKRHRDELKAKRTTSAGKEHGSTDTPDTSHPNEPEKTDGGPYTYSAYKVNNDGTLSDRENLGENELDTWMNSAYGKFANIRVVRDQDGKEIDYTDDGSKWVVQNKSMPETAVSKELKKEAIDLVATLKGIQDGSMAGFDPALFRSSFTGKVKRRFDAGHKDEAAAALEYLKSIQGVLGKPALANNNAIWKLVGVEPASSSSAKSGDDARYSDAVKKLGQLKPFMPDSQIQVIGKAMKGEEKQFFFGKVAEYADRISTMPKVYEQDGKGDAAVAYLHYFSGGSDWYILERDTSEEQLQAFGYAILNGDKENAELGYISIPELTKHGVELDLYWEPKTLAEVKGDIGEPDEGDSVVLPPQDQSEKAAKNAAKIIYALGIEHEVMQSGFRGAYESEDATKMIIATESNGDGLNIFFRAEREGQKRKTAMMRTDSAGYLIPDTTAAMLADFMKGLADNEFKVAADTSQPEEPGPGLKPVDTEHTEESIQQDPAITPESNSENGKEFPEDAKDQFRALGMTDGADDALYWSTEIENKRINLKAKKNGNKYSVWRRAQVGSIVAPLSEIFSTELLNEAVEFIAGKIAEYNGTMPAVVPVEPGNTEPPAVIIANDVLSGKYDHLPPDEMADLVDSVYDLPEDQYLDLMTKVDAYTTELTRKAVAEVL